MKCPCLGYGLSGLCPVRVVTCPGYVLSGLCPVQVMSCPGYVLSGLWTSGLWVSGLWVSGLRESGLCPSTSFEFLWWVVWWVFPAITLSQPSYSYGCFVVGVVVVVGL